MFFADGRYDHVSLHSCSILSRKSFAAYFLVPDVFLVSFIDKKYTFFLCEWNIFQKRKSEFSEMSSGSMDNLTLFFTIYICSNDREYFSLKFRIRKIKFFPFL